MKKLMLLAAGFVALALTACNGTVPTLTFAQQVSIACGAANGEVAILQGDGVFTGGAADTLTKKVQPAIEKVCAAGASVTKPDLQTLVDTTLPLVKTFIDASSMDAQQKTTVEIALTAASVAVSTALAQYVEPVATPAAPASDASAPVAASAPAVQ